MPEAWRTVRVFISSTFRDMQAERDHLVRFVFPRLREELLPRRIHLVDVDLRWGVTSEQDALEVCREIIDECRPRFICILGGRYGWVPPGKEHSITADEVRYGVLDRLEVKEYRYFYFREPEATECIPEEAARVGGYREADPANARKLADLKEAIADAGFQPFIYPARWDAESQRLVGLEAFGERVYADLLASVDDEFGTVPPKPLNEFAEEDAAMEAFVQERVERYVVGSRQSVFDDLTEFARGDSEPSIFTLTGPSGCGKSALLGKFSQDYAARRPKELVITQFVGASAGSTDLRRTLRRLCHALTATTGEREIPQEVKELAPLFEELLAAAAQRQRVVLMLDALNQLDAADNAHTMYWLPRSLPTSVRVIISSLEHPALEAVRRRGKSIKEIPLQPLIENDARAIIAGFLARYRKRMSEEQITALLGKRESGNPLYLLAALEELRTLGTYKEITQRIETLPGEVQPLFLWILKRLEDDPGFRDSEGRLIGAVLVRQFVSCLGVSRHGLSQMELAELIAPGDPPDAQGNVAALARLLRPYLMQRGELLDFYHTQLREAVEAEYLDEEPERLAAHRQLAAYFRRKADPAGDATWSGGHVRGLSELPYHQTQGEMWAEVEATLTGLLFVGAKSKAGLVHELQSDYDIALDRWPGYERYDPFACPPPRPVPGWLSECVQAVLKRRDNPYPERGAGPVLGRARLLAHEQSSSGRQERQDGTDAGRTDVCRSGEQGRPGAAHGEGPSTDALAGDGNTQGVGTSASRVAAFAAFVAAHGHALASFPDGAIAMARNHAQEGVVVACAEPLAEALDCGWVARDPRPAAISGRPPCIRVIAGGSWITSAVAMSADGRVAISAGQGEGDIDNENCLRVWDVSRGVCLQTLDIHNKRASDVAMTPDGQMAVSVGKDHALRVWDVTSGKCTATLEADWLEYRPYDDETYVWHEVTVALTADGKMAVSGREDGTLRVWDLTSGTCVRTFGGRGDGMSAVEVTPDGTIAVSATPNGVLRVWDVALGQCLLALKGHSDRINSLAVAADGTTAVSASDDSTLRVWDIGVGSCRRVLAGHRSAVRGVALTPDGSVAVSAGYDMTVRVWDVGSGECLRSFPGHGYCVNSVAVTANGKIAVSGSDDSTLRVWDLSGTPWAERLVGHGEMLMRGGSAPDGGTVLARRPDGLVRAYAIATGTLVRTYEWRTNDVGIEKIALGPDGSTAVSCAGLSLKSRGLERETDLRVWTVATGSCLRALEGHQGFVDDIMLGPDGRTALSASRDRTLRIWDIATSMCLRVLKGHTHWCVAASFTPDGAAAISTGADFTLRVWDVGSGECLQAVQTDRMDQRMAVTADGKTILSAGMDVEVRGESDYMIRIWDLRRGELAAVLSGHADSVNEITSTPDGKIAISASDDETLRVWDIASGECLAVYWAGAAVCALSCVRPDGRLVCATRDAQMHFLALRRVVQGPPIVTATRIFALAEPDRVRGAGRREPSSHLRGVPSASGQYDHTVTALCVWCGRRFVPSSRLLDTIAGIARDSRISVGESACLRLPVAAWEEPRLLSECTYCRRPLKFNPFIVDNSERYPVT